MPELFYKLAGRLSADRPLAYTLIAFGPIGGPLLAVSLDRGELYAVAAMAAGWWPIVLLLKFHPQHRPLSTKIEDWFYAFVLDLHAVSVLGVLLIAATNQ